MVYWIDSIQRQRPKQYKESEFIPFIPWGHVLIDECHKEKKNDTAVIKVCYFSYNAMRWMYSGTLLETDLKSDLSSYLAPQHCCARNDSHFWKPLPFQPASSGIVWRRHPVSQMLGKIISRSDRRRPRVAAPATRRGSVKVNCLECERLNGCQIGRSFSHRNTISILDQSFMLSSS